MADETILGYEAMYGLAPANYSMHGSPAGLARIDALFGLKMYTSTFTASPLVFGAMPSLHAGCATVDACFMGYVFPRGKWLSYTYVMWVWWATLYLQHHYAVDLIAGTLCKLLSALESRFRHANNSDSGWHCLLRRKNEVPS